MLSSLFLKSGVFSKAAGIHCANRNEHSGTTVLLATVAVDKGQRPHLPALQLYQHKATGVWVKSLTHLTQFLFLYTDGNI